MIQWYECPQLLEGLLYGRFSRTPERDRQREHRPLNNVIGRQTLTHIGMNYHKEFKDHMGSLGNDCVEQIQDIVGNSIR